MYKGAYLSRQLRTGRAVVIPKFGSFTFTAPSVRLAVFITIFGIYYIFRELQIL